MNHIFHPTDLGTGSATAFLHALRLAVATRAELTVLHVDSSGEKTWEDLPGVRETLARWKLLKDRNDMDGLKAIGVGVRKVLAEGGRPVAYCMNYLKKHPTDLVVLATQQEGASWMRGSVAEPISRGAGEPSLFVPERSRGFVDQATGAVSLSRILVPVAEDPSPRRAIDVALRMADTLATGAVHVTLLHVGNAASQPMLNVPERSGLVFERMLREGDAVEQIAHVADATNTDLVVMTTKGHDGFLDMLRGSTTERVLRAVKCPVLAVPAISMEGA